MMQLWHFFFAVSQTFFKNPFVWIRLTLLLTWPPQRCNFWNLMQNFTIISSNALLWSHAHGLLSTLLTAIWIFKVFVKSEEVRRNHKSCYFMSKCHLKYASYVRVEKKQKYDRSARIEIHSSAHMCKIV